jgi:hypothetical protein
MNLIVREIERALAHAKNRSTARPSTDNVNSGNSSAHRWFPQGLVFLPNYFRTSVCACGARAGQACYHTSSRLAAPRSTSQERPSR